MAAITKLRPKGANKSSIHLAAPAVEGAARNLLIELDEGIYRAQADKEPGGGYPGLYTLISELEKLSRARPSRRRSGVLPAGTLCIDRPVHDKANGSCDRRV